jgi:S-DNA-T family DNA segregation ATPase FtsK/SpoIIIE
MIRVKQWNSYPVELLELVDLLEEVRPLTAVLGISQDGRPLLLSMMARDVSNILIAGEPGSGKSGLLRALLFSLANYNKQHQMQAVIIDFDPAARPGAEVIGPLSPFSYLPHLLQPVISTRAETIEALEFLVKETDYRLDQRIASPLILLVIDRVDTLLAAGGQPVLHRLLYLLQDGPRVGIRLALSLETPVGPNMNGLLKSDLPVRFIGRLQDEKMARAAAGVPETQAEFLQGQGDFVAVHAGQIMRFRAAYIGDYDLYLAIEQLRRQKQGKIVAPMAQVRSEPEYNEILFPSY